ncbi:MAG TPA: hypothetical protein VGJ57_02720 [Nitrospirales bacterium]
MRSLILTSAVVLLFTGPGIANAFWPVLRCTDANGVQVFTDSRPASSLYCERYSPQSPRNTMEKVQDNSNTSAKDAEVRFTVEPRVSNPVITGNMDFSSLARLSVGMTEAAVLVVAGPPKVKLPGTWIYSMDDLTVELLFGGGPPSLAEIRQYQTKAR